MCLPGTVEKVRESEPTITRRTALAGGGAAALAALLPGEAVAHKRRFRLRRGKLVDLGSVGTTEEVLTGPSHTPDGSMNIFGALRRAMATTGYSDLKEFQRVEVTVADSQHRR